MVRNRIEPLVLNILQVSQTLFNESLGVDLHFTILTHAKEILKIVKGIAEHNKQINNLEKIEDSVQLCAIIGGIKKMTRIIPHL